MGGCLLPLNIRLHPKELSYIITHSAPKVIFIDANLLAMFRQIPAKALVSVKYYIICGENMRSANWSVTSSHISPTIDFEQFVSTYGNEYNTYSWPNLSHKSGAFLFYTSGTTGNPKGIVYSHRSVYLTSLSYQKMYEPYDCVLLLHPFFHVAGGYAPILAMTMGFKSLLPNNCYDFNELLEFSLKECVTKMGGVPTMILGLVNALKSNPKKYESFRGKLSFATGGSAIPAYLVTWLCDEWGISVRHAWGMSECMPGSMGQRIQTRSDLFKSSEEQTENVLLQGILNPILETKLIHPNNENIEIKKDGKQVGEIIVRGPCATRMYFKNEKPENFMHGEWLKTGDIASINERKVLRITDRSKDLIKSGGEWISSVDMENYTMELNEIELACVVGIKHAKWVQRPIVIVQLKENEGLTKREVLKHIGNKFARFQIPDDVLFWDKIPMTATNKLAKKVVRQMLEKQDYKLPNEQQIKQIKSKL
eukprot:148790_1